MLTVVRRAAALAGCLFICAWAAHSTAPGKDQAKTEAKKSTAAATKKAASTAANKQNAVQVAAAEDDKAPPSKPAGKKAAKDKDPDPTTKPAGVKSSAEVAAIVKQIRAAKSNLTPADTGRLAKAQASAKAAAGRLDHYLSDMGEERNAWKQYLHWDQLQAELQKKKGFDVAVLESLHRRLTAGYDGLELPPFQNLAIAVEALAIQAENVDDSTQQPVPIGVTLDELASTVEAIGDGTPTAEQTAVIGRDVTRLSRSGQASNLVAALTSRYSQPNLLVDVAETFVTEGDASTVDEIAPVNECILGTTIRGTGHTIGSLTFDFIEDPNEAQIATYFQAVNHSRTVGSNKSALICSSGRTELCGSQLLFVGENGLYSRSVVANAVVHNQITGIGSTKSGIMGKIVKKIAAKKAPEQKGQAEAIAAAHAKRNLAQRMKTETDRVIADANDELGRRLRDPLERFGAVPRLIKLSSTDDSLRIRVLQEGPSRFAAPVAAPKPLDAGIALRLHRSVVENSAAQILAGRKFDGPRIRDLVENQFGLTMKESEDDTPFSITFADQDPISLAFKDGIVSVTVRGKGFTSEDKSYEGMNITANYKAETDGRRAKLVRQGDFVIVPPGFVSGRDKLALSQTALKRLLQRRFEKTFKAEYVGEGLTLEGELSKLGTLFVSKLRVDDDWLVVGLDRRQEQTAQVATSPLNEAE